MGRRLDRVGSLLKEEISRVILQEMSDPRMGFVTVTSVKPTPDLQNAVVYISVLGSPAEIRATLRGLDHARGYIQGLVGKRAVFRYTPKLRFVYDKSVSEGIRISRLLRDEGGPEETPPVPPAVSGSSEEE